MTCFFFTAVSAKKLLPPVFELNSFINQLAVSWRVCVWLVWVFKIYLCARNVGNFHATWLLCLCYTMLWVPCFPFWFYFLMTCVAFILRIVVTFTFAHGQSGKTAFTWAREKGHKYIAWLIFAVRMHKPEPRHSWYHNWRSVSFESFFFEMIIICTLNQCQRSRELSSVSS